MPERHGRITGMYSAEDVLRALQLKAFISSLTYGSLTWIMVNETHLAAEPLGNGGAERGGNAAGIDGWLGRNGISPVCSTP